MNRWLERATYKLEDLSSKPDTFSSMAKEWQYVGATDLVDTIGSCQLCGQEALRFEYKIENIINHNSMIVGSKCILHFMDQIVGDFLDPSGNIVDEKRLKNDMHEVFLEWTIIALNDRFVQPGNSFTENVANAIENETPISPKQANLLYRFYQNCSEDEKRALRNVVKINLKRDKYKQQIMAELPKYKVQFISKFMSSQQKAKYTDYL